jgi:uncharacterized protein YneF (UPF0154 family)
MTVSTFLMHVFYIGAPLIVGFFVGMKYAKRSNVEVKPIEIDQEEK